MTNFRFAAFVVSAAIAFALTLGAATEGNFDALTKQADQDKATKTGWHYAIDVFSTAFFRLAGPAMRTCLTQPDTIKPATLVFVVSADGKVTRAVAEPGIPYGQCIVSKLQLPFTAPRPPHANFAVAVGVANHHNEETKSKAPVDHPAQARGETEVAAYEKAIAPYVAKARATWPEAKKRYLAGLPQGWAFSVSYRLLQTDEQTKQARFEDTFVNVKEIKGGMIRGTIANKLGVVTNHRFGETITFPESKITNWVFIRPDGSEEAGNFVGKFLDEYNKRPH